MLFRQLFEKESSTYTYLLADPETKDAILIDPVRETEERDLQVLEDLGLSLRYVLETHVHADHVTSAGHLREKTGAQVVISKVSGAEGADVYVEDGDVVHFGKYAVEVRSTPGHTNGCLTFVTADRKKAFTGDALLIRGSGRTDFQQGDAKELYHSVHDKILSLPDETELFPGHDYKGRTMSTVGEERALNPRLGGENTEGDFVEIMANLKLGNPKKMDFAVPANLKLGYLEGEVPAQAERAAPWADFVRSGTGVPEVTPQWVNENAGRMRIIDVRGDVEFLDELGHVAGAENVPLQHVVEEAQHWDRSQPIVTICRSGGRSGRAALDLEAMGFSKVVSMRGGMLLWNNLSLCVLHTPKPDMSSLEGVRDEMLACYVQMYGGDEGSLEPEFKHVFEEVGGAFDKPSKQDLEKVLLKLKESAIEKGMSLAKVEPHLTQFQDALRSGAWAR
jgi:glyoxylase-like metal-dependent hydrolase (beta-lactamase superfamily II)/rhodanese-related sulfurtransferase